MTNFYYLTSPGTPAIGTDGLEFAQLYAPAGTAVDPYFAITQAETTAGLSIQPGIVGQVAYTKFEPGDVRRYGAVGDALWDSGLGAWAGTDNTVPFNTAAIVARVSSGGEIGTTEKSTAQPMQNSTWPDGTYGLGGSAGPVTAPAGGHYLITGDVDFRETALDFKSRIWCATPGTATVFMGSNALSNPTAPQYMYSVLSYDGSYSSAAADQFDIELRGCKHQHVEIEHCRSLRIFATAAIGAVTGSERDYAGVTSYATMKLGYIDQIVLDSDPPQVNDPGPLGGTNSTGGWQTSFKMDIQQFRLFESRGDWDTYSANHILVNGGGTDGAVIDIISGSYIRFINQRFESVKFVRFGKKTSGCSIEFQYNGIRDWPGAAFAQSSDYTATYLPADIVAAAVPYDRIQNFGTRNIVVRAEAKVLQWHPVLLLDAATFDGCYNGVGNISDTDPIVTTGDSVVGTIVKVGNKLTVAPTTKFVQTGLIPITPDKASHLTVIAKGVGPATDAGFRVATVAYGKDRNIIRQRGSKQREISDLAVYKWTVSPATAGEYYLEALAGGDPMIGTAASGGNLNKLYLSDNAIEKGTTVGSLADQTWIYDDGDTLGYDTIYIRDDAGGNPQTSGVALWLDNAQCSIISISQEAHGSIVTNTKHGLLEGDKITMDGIEPDVLGTDMGVLNTNPVWVQSVVDDYTFTIDRDTRGLGVHTGTTGQVNRYTIENSLSSYENYGSPGQPQSNQHEINLSFISDDTYYVRVSVSVGGITGNWSSGDFEFDSLHIVVGSPKTNKNRYDSDLLNFGESLASHIPQLMAPIAQKFGAGTPTVATTTPDHIGQQYIDTTAHKIWVATEISNPAVYADWKILN